jgi:hypothetical protein
MLSFLDIEERVESNMHRVNGFIVAVAEQVCPNQPTTQNENIELFCRHDMTDDYGIQVVLTFLRDEVLPLLDHATIC